MRFRRVAATTTLAAMAGGAALLIGTQSGSAATPPPTQITLADTGLGTSFCPLPINGTVALKPGTTVLFKPPILLGALNTYTLKVLSEAKTNPPQTAKAYNVPNAGTKVGFGSAGTYDLSWTESLLNVLGLPPKLKLTQHAKLVISPNAQACQVAVQVPTPGVSVPGAGPVNSIVNGVVGSVVGGVNAAVSPVNSAVGPILGGVNSGLGGLTGGKSGSAGHPSAAPTPRVSTIYTPSGDTPAQQTVPQGYGGGNGAAGAGLTADGKSINAPAIGFKGLGNASATNQSVKSGGSPKTVDLAANKPQSALGGWANLIVLVAVLALSGATAFYARTYLLHPLPAKVRADRR